jgi:hypothetical protein
MMDAVLFGKILQPGDKKGPCHMYKGFFQILEKRIGCSMSANYGIIALNKYFVLSNA